MRESAGVLVVLAMQETIWLPSAAWIVGALLALGKVANLARGEGVFGVESRKSTSEGFDDAMVGSETNLAQGAVSTVSESVARWTEEGPILDEDLEDRTTPHWARLRRKLGGGWEDSAAAIEVLRWVWSDHGDGTLIDVQSHTAEYRNRSVPQLLVSQQSACRELNSFYVAALREMGVPARHCTVGRWLHRDSFHFFAEYWDADQEQWVTVDTSDDKYLTAETPADRAANGRWNSLVYYAYPGNPEESDLYGKGRWDKMVNITGDLAEEFPMEIVWPDLERGGTLSAQIWNGGSWRTILIQEVKAGERPVVVNFGKTHVTTRPVMFSADIGGERYLAMVKAAALDHKVVLEKVEGGSPWLGRRVRSQRR